MDRFLTLLLVIDIHIWLLLDLTRWISQIWRNYFFQKISATQPSANYIESVNPNTLSDKTNVSKSNKEGLKVSLQRIPENSHVSVNITSEFEDYIDTSKQCRQFLDRIAREPVLSAEEKNKLIDIAFHGPLDLQLEAICILSDFPEHQHLVWQWLDEQDCRLLQKVQSMLNTYPDSFSPELIELVNKLKNDISFSKSLIYQHVNAKTSPSTLETPLSVSHMIPEFATPHELFMALQHLQKLPADLREKQTRAIISTAIASDDQYLRGAAVAAMSRYQIENASAQLRLMLKDESEYVRGCALDALCQLEKCSALQTLDIILQEEKSLEVLEIALINLSHLHNPEALATLERRLSNIPDILQPLARRIIMNLTKLIAPSKDLSS